jgi:hypothetical protein
MYMTIWEKFETECTEYLNKKFGNLASFTNAGGSDSTISDIYVRTRKGKEFYIEAKHSPAQCGQFVLLPNISTRSFEYSRLNITPLNSAAKTIIRHMNADFDAYKEAGTTGKDIDLHDGGKIFAEWIIDSYKNKGTIFFITNDYTILRVDDFLEYFYVTAKYRVKRSGSSGVGKSNISEVYNHILKSGFNIGSHVMDGAKLFVTSPDMLHNTRFVFGNYEYMFSQRGSQYEIRKLSNTFNANVIFSIEKKSKQGLSDMEFSQFLK